MTTKELKINLIYLVEKYILDTKLKQELLNEIYKKEVPGVKGILDKIVISEVPFD